MITRMVIAEAISDTQLDEMAKAFDEYGRGLQAFSAGTGPFQGFRVLREYDGRMVVLETDWTALDACTRAHSSREYRKLIADTQHLLVGDFVMKLFSQPVGRSSVSDYEVHVGNIGLVYKGENYDKARGIFREYIEQSMSGVSRAAGENVTLMENSEPINEFLGREERHDK